MSIAYKNPFITSTTSRIGSCMASPLVLSAATNKRSTSSGLFVQEPNSTPVKPMFIKSAPRQILAGTREVSGISLSANCSTATSLASPRTWLSSGHLLREVTAQTRVKVVGKLAGAVLTNVTTSYQIANRRRVQAHRGNHYRTHPNKWSFPHRGFE
jgi:hypothetical protein